MSIWWVLSGVFLLIFFICLALEPSNRPPYDPSARAKYERDRFKNRCPRCWGTGYYSSEWWAGKNFTYKPLIKCGCGSRRRRWWE
jgi:hypothetical protein